MSSKMKMHVALHDAGEAVFDFLDSMGGNPGISCNQSSAVLLAASAAMLRESSVEEANTVIKQLDQSVASILKEQNQVLIPAPVRTLATALQHI